MNVYEELQRCAKRLKSIAEHSRLQIISLLLRGPKDVGTIADAINVSIPMTSHHLRILWQSGVVVSSKSGRHVIYSLHPDVHVPSTDGPAEDAIVIGGLRLLVTRGPARSLNAEQRA